MGPWCQHYKTFAYTNIYTNWLASDKHSSLLQIFMNYGCKMFHNIGLWCQYYKTYTYTNIRLGCEGLLGTNTLAY
jgi:hypothetical protein